MSSSSGGTTSLSRSRWRRCATWDVSCAKLWRLIDAEDHRELVHTLQVMAKYDIPLNCALKDVEYPDYDDLSDAIEEEMNAFVDAAEA